MKRAADLSIVSIGPLAARNWANLSQSDFFCFAVVSAQNFLVYWRISGGIDDGASWLSNEAITTCWCDVTTFVLSTFVGYMNVFAFKTRSRYRPTSESCVFDVADGVDLACDGPGGHNAFDSVIGFIFRVICVTCVIWRGIILTYCFPPEAFFGHLSRKCSVLPHPKQARCPDLMATEPLKAGFLGISLASFWLIPFNALPISSATFG